MSACLAATHRTFILTNQFPKCLYYVILTDYSLYFTLVQNQTTRKPYTEYMVEICPAKSVVYNGYYIKRLKG